MLAWPAASARRCPPDAMVASTLLQYLQAHRGRRWRSSSVEAFAASQLPDVFRQQPRAHRSTCAGTPGPAAPAPCWRSRTGDSATLCFAYDAALRAVDASRAFSNTAAAGQPVPGPIRFRCPRDGSRARVYRRATSPRVPHGPGVRQRAAPPLINPHGAAPRCSWRFSPPQALG